jgi:hypothetical protein
METIIQSGRSVIMLSPNGKTLVRKASPGPGLLVSTILDGIRALVPDKTGRRARNEATAAT